MRHPLTLSLAETERLTTGSERVRPVRAAGG